MPVYSNYHMHARTHTQTGVSQLATYCEERRVVRVSTSWGSWRVEASLIATTILALVVLS